MNFLISIIGGMLGTIICEIIMLLVIIYKKNKNTKK